MSRAAMVTDARAKTEGKDAGEVRFSRKEARDALVVGDTQLKIHLARLVDLELVHAHRQGLRVLYELAWRGEGADGEPVLLGLIDIEKLARSDYDPKRSAPQQTRSGGGRPSVGGVSAVGRPGSDDDKVTHKRGNGVAARTAAGPVVAAGAA